MNRSGVTALTTAEGLALLDAATGRPQPHAVTARLDLPALRAAGPLPPLLAGLARTGPRRAAAAAPAGRWPRRWRRCRPRTVTGRWPAWSPPTPRSCSATTAPPR